MPVVSTFLLNKSINFLQKCLMKSFYHTFVLKYFCYQQKLSYHENITLWFMDFEDIDNRPWNWFWPFIKLLLSDVNVKSA